MKEDVQKAIAIVQDSRRSHETWLIWYDQHPEDEVKYSSTCGDKKWHHDAIAGYDFVIGLLKKVELQEK